jgi:Ca2+-binding RTX toxin-like protein
MPFYNATLGVDTLTADDQDDTFIVPPGTVQAGDYFDAAGGADILQVGENFSEYYGPDPVFDFRTVTLQGFETLQFSSANDLNITVQLSGAQAGAINSVIGNGGNGSNIIEVSLSATASFSAANWSFASWTSGYLAIIGAAGAEVIVGSQESDLIEGLAGDDVINGGGGDDLFSWVVGDGHDTIDGGAGYDWIEATGSGGADLGQLSWNGSAVTDLMGNSLSNIELISLDLGAGIDWLIYNTNVAVTVDLGTNAASGGVVYNVEKVVGGSGGDTLTGDALDNRLDGQGGNDTLNGGAGSDTVLGGDGDDTIFASVGNDSLQGLAGNDTFHWSATDGRDTFNGGADTDTVNLTGAAVAEVADTNWNGSTITGLLNSALINIENVHLDMGAGGDWLRYNTTFGVSVDLGAGTATGYASIANVENLIGGTGGDTLTGDAGANKINGNSGNDTITGGAASDNLIGGLGSDTFVYAAGAGADTINDFDAWADGGQDFIDVTAFGITAGDFGSRVAIIDVGAETVVRIDNDAFITLKNVTGDGDNSISIADFILA